MPLVTTDRDIADIDSNAAKLAAVNADTNITINPPSRPVSEVPQFTLPRRPREQVVAERPVPTPSSHVVTPPPITTRTASPGVSTRTVQRINWGGVIKGVAIVAAVAVVAVVGAGFVAGFAGDAIAAFGGTEIGASVLATGSSIITGVGDALGAAAASVGGFFSGIGESLFGTGAVAEVTAPPATEVAAASSAASKGAGALAIGGVAAGSVVAAKSILPNLHLFDSVQQTVVQPLPAPTGLEAGDPSIALAAKKQTAMHASLADQTHAAADHKLHEEMLAAKSASTASKMAHHAGEHAHTATEADLSDLSEPEPEKRSHGRSALQQGLDKQREWVERTQKTSSYGHALREHGSHADAVRSTHKPAGAVAPRHSEFAEQLSHDRAALDAALEPTR